MIKTALPDYIKREFKLMDGPEEESREDLSEESEGLTEAQRQKMHEEYVRDKADVMDDLNCLLVLMKDRIQDGHVEDGEHFCYMNALGMKSRILGFFYEDD